VNSQVKRAWAYLNVLGMNAGNHKIGLASAGITFYVLFAMVPTVIALSLMASTFLPAETVTEVAVNVSSTLGVATTQGAAWLPLANLASSTAGSNIFTLSSLIAILVASFSASRIVITIRTTFDDIFNVKDLRHSLVQRLAAAVITIAAFFTVVCVAAILLLVPKVSAFVGGTAVRFDNTFVNFIAAFFITLVAVFTLFRYAPHYSQKFLSREHKVSPRARIGVFDAGVWLTAVWILVSTFFLQYFITLSTGSTATIMIFGSSASIMIWMYLVWFGIFLGAEVTALRSVNYAKSGLSV